MKNQIALVLIIMAIAVGLVGLGSGLVSLGVTSPISSTGGSAPVLSITPCSDGETYTFDAGTSTWTCGNAGHLLQDEALDLAAEPTLNFTGAGVVCTDNPGNTRTDCTITGVAGSGVQLDLGNDDVIESTGITEINVDNDTNSIFTETPADQLLIDASLNWPISDTADALSANGGNCGAGNYPLGVDAAGAVEDCTAEAFAFGTINAPLGTDPVADLVSDTLNLTSTSSTVDITGTAGTDTVDFDAVDLNCTNCLNATEIEDIYVLVAGDVITGDLDFDDGVADSPKAIFTPATGTAWELYTQDSTDDLQIEANAAGDSGVQLVNAGAGDATLLVDSLATGGVAECVQANSSGLISITGAACGGAPTFDLIGSGTNTTATMTVGDGGFLTVASGGLIDATNLLNTVHNDSGGVLFECTAVHIADFDIPSDLPEILIADADNSATMPAIGLLFADIANGADGFIVVAGQIDDLDTVTGEGWSVGDTLYVNDSGTSADVDCGNTLTNTRPADTGDEVQAIAIVERVHTTQGRLKVIGAGRSNDVPNLPDDQVWVGSATNVATASAIADCDVANLDRLQYDTTTNAFSCATGAVAAGEYAAASIDGDDVNSNIAGRSLTLTAASPDTLDADVELYTDTKGIWFENPTAVDDFKSIWITRDIAVTITGIWCESDQTVTMMLQKDDGTPADLDSVDLICITTPDTDDALDGDASFADGDRLDLAITSVSGTPTWVSIMWTYTKDD